MNHLDEDALRYAAFIQAQLVVIEEQSEVLNDLGDLQAHRKLKADVADYIEYQSKSGKIPSNPLSLIKGRLNNLSDLLSECISLENGILALGSFSEKIDVPNVSLKLLNKTSASLSKWRNELDGKLDSLRDKINSLNWESEKSDAKVHSELLVCADVLTIIMPDSEEVLNLRLLLFKSGPKYDFLIKSLKDKSNIINHLIEVHSNHVDTIKEVEIQNASGNYNTALNKLHSIGLKLNVRKKVKKKKSTTEIKENENQFSDIDYENAINKTEALISFKNKLVLWSTPPVTVYCLKCNEKLREWDSGHKCWSCGYTPRLNENKSEKLFFNKLNIKRLKNKEHKQFTKEAHALLSSENKRYDKSNKYLLKFSNSEIENDCKPLLLNISKEIKDKENELSRIVDRARWYRRIKLCVELTFLLSLCYFFYWCFSAGRELN